MIPQAGPARPRVPFASLEADYAGRRGAIDAAIGRVLRSGWFVLGEEVEAFEEAFARFVGVPHVVACGNGTEALALALLAAGARPGDEVVVPANTCSATAAGVRLAGAVPRLADVDADTLTLDAASAERTLTPATRFLLPVHLYGGAADLEGLRDLADRRGLTLIEDCAQSHGARHGGRMTGAFGAAAAFSFYPTKNLGAYGDGGAVVTSDPHIAAALRQLRQYGWSRRDVAEREGWNSRLDELQAAILSAKLPDLESGNDRRRQIASRYDAGLEGLPLKRLALRPGTVSSRHLYPVRVEGRDAFRAFLAEQGVETGIHYPVPLHLQPAYAFLGGGPGDFPVSESACATLVSLPIHPGLSDAQVDTAVCAVRDFFEVPP